MSEKSSEKHEEQNEADEEIRKVGVEWALYQLCDSTIKLVEACHRALITEHMVLAHKIPAGRDLRERYWKDYSKAKEEFKDAVESLRNILLER